MSVSQTTTDSLACYIDHWDPEPMQTSDDLIPATAQRLAATLGLGGTFDVGATLPPLWQWLYFNEWPSTAELGPDGHPLEGQFLPPIPARRRMFAGGRVTMTAPLTLGTLTERTSRVTAVKVKAGRTGELLFVTVRHEYGADGKIAVAEEQDIVYRSDSGVPAAMERVSEPLAESPAPWTTRPITTATLLFRFSALTANAHRIHYDEPYATAVEGYPALVVHGPLLAVYMAELVRSRVPGRATIGFQFRLNKPVFVGDAIEVQGSPDGDAVHLEVVSGAGTVHASASAQLA